MNRIVIIGAGHAAIQCAASLRDLGNTSPITIIGAESDLPYHRPPNSKKYVVEGVPEDFSLLRAADFYENEKIDLLLGETVESVDPAGRQVKLASGSELGFEKLVMAPGSEPRTLPIPGIEHALSLYSLQDARDIYARLSAAGTVSVIGGGFIGLEIAAAAAAALPLLDGGGRSRGGIVWNHIDGIMKTTSWRTSSPGSGRLAKWNSRTTLIVGRSMKLTEPRVKHQVAGIIRLS